jgi:DNA polymerase-3 subunit delta'
VWSVVGQDPAVAMLSRCLAEERVSHAYLFVGPAQVGKATTARRFAQALNCLGDAPPCGECRACRLIGEDKHPDVEVMGVGGVCDEAEHRDHRSDGSRDIRICQVRRVERVLSRTPFEGRYRVIIVDPADALTTEAANAFLKTLEEPPSHVVLILVAEREEALPPTVRSRCRRVPLAAAPVSVVARALGEQWSVPPERARLLARLSRGRLGWALGALVDEGVLEGMESALEEAERLAESGYAERFAAAAELAARYPRDPGGVLGILETWQQWWRDVLLLAVGRSEQVTHLDQLDRLRRQASQYGVEGSLQALEALARVAGELEENANATLALEVLMLELPGQLRADR